MADEFQTNPSDRRDRQDPDITRQAPPLPFWLARRLLRRDEKITWVCGPSFNPSWERFVTHPLLLVVALALGALCLGAGWGIADSPRELPVLPVLAAGVIVLGSLFLVGFASGYFTRLVVTNFRLVIMQGYEVRSSWGIDDLPYSLVRYAWLGDGAKARTIDLDAVKTMLGNSSDKVAESKTIVAFGKHLNQIRARDKDRD